MEIVRTLARACHAIPLVLLVTVGGAQPVETRADRYARDLQQARAAATAKDHAAALAAYERLVREAPYHPGFHYQIARASAVTGQTARAVSELEKALALGYDFGEKLDDAFAVIGPETGAPKIAGLIRQSRRQVGASRVAFTIAQRDLTPEGIAYDPKDGAFYLGSTWKSKIVRLDASGRLREFAAERQDGLRAVLGLRIDTARRALWAVSVPNPLNPQRDPNEERPGPEGLYHIGTAGNYPPPAGFATPVSRSNCPTRNPHRPAPDSLPVPSTSHCRSAQGPFPALFSNQKKRIAPG